MAVTVEYPPTFPGVPRGWWYLKHGFEQIGCKVNINHGIMLEGYWRPEHSLPGPVHIAALEVNGKRVWYDCSDFAPSHPYIGTPYFAKNALEADCPPVRPIGQYLGTEPELFLKRLPALRELTKHKTIDVLAVFSNIDEGNYGAHLRRPFVKSVKDRPGVEAGLWRWGKRPEVPPELKANRVEPAKHWQRIAQSRVVVCLPGVGGDSTRLRTEALAIGSCVLTVKGEQEWPGISCGVWAEADRNVDSLVEVMAELSADPKQCERIARAGRRYFDRNLRPESMAERVVRACA